MTSTLEPLRHPTFRRIWIASLLCNGAQQIQVVVAAWMMVELTRAPERVALVQTAMFVPMMLLALPGGVLADLYDRRKAALAALTVAFCGGLAQALLGLAGAASDRSILICCLIIGTGFALFAPAWQASVIELVGTRALPAAVALNSMSTSVARSVGPTVGGLLAAAAGAVVALSLNALLYLPMIAALLLWRRRHVPPAIPPEDLARAAVSGIRYAALSSPVRRVLCRAMLSALGTSSVYALLPIITHAVGADAGTYGLLVGAFGLGAVAAAVATTPLRARFTPEKSVRVYSCLQGVATLVLALSPFRMLSAAALFICGACWVANNATYNISIQMTAPGWVAGRMLALFHASVAAGLGLGSWLWGAVASASGAEGTGAPIALMLAGILLLISPAFGFFLRLPPHAEDRAQSVPATTVPEVRLDLDGRRGAIILLVSYCIPESRVAEFRRLMRSARRSHERNGAYAISLAQDIAHPLLWVQSLRYPTWHDYVRARDRPTAAERELHAQIMALHEGPGPVGVQRLLERAGRREVPVGE